MEQTNYLEWTAVLFARNNYDKDKTIEQIRTLYLERIAFLQEKNYEFAIVRIKKQMENIILFLNEKE